MKKTKFYCFSVYVIILLLIYSSAANGQFGTPSGPSKQVKVEYAKNAKERALLVVLTINPDFNTKIEAVVKQYWKFNKNISFTSEANLSKLLTGKDEKYCVLAVQNITITEYMNGATFQNEFLRFALSLGEDVTKKKPLFYHNVAFIDDDRKFKKVKVFRKGTDYKLDLDKKTILFAIDFIQNHLIARTAEKTRTTFYYEPIENTGKLATKTLLIAREDVDEKLIENEIKQIYPYSYKIVDAKEIEKLYLQRSKEYAFVEIAPLGESRGIMMHFVVNCADGQLLSLGELFNGFGDKFSNLVSKGHLKAYVKNANRK